MWKLLCYKEVECCREGVRRDQVQAHGRRRAVHDPYRLVPGPCWLVGGGRIIVGHPRVRIRSLLLFLAASDKASGMMYNREAEMRYTFVIVGTRLQIARRTGLS